MVDDYVHDVQRRLSDISRNHVLLILPCHRTHRRPRYASSQRVALTLAWTGDHCLILILAPFWAIVIVMPFVFCLVLFGRQYLRVTSTDFEIRRTMGLPDRCPSTIDDPDSGWRASAIDRCLRTQLKGKTKFLQGAKVRETDQPPRRAMHHRLLISGGRCVDRLLQTERAASGREPHDTPDFFDSFEYGPEMDRRGNQRRLNSYSR